MRPSLSAFCGSFEIILLLSFGEAEIVEVHALVVGVFEGDGVGAGFEWEGEWLAFGGDREECPVEGAVTEAAAGGEVEDAEGLAIGTVSEGYAADAGSDTVIAQGVAANTRVLAGTPVDITVNQQQPELYYPVSKLSVVVPLNGSQVRIQIGLSSGETREVYQGTLNTGTYRIALPCEEAGTHPVTIFMDGVQMEVQEIEFS